MSEHLSPEIGDAEKVERILANDWHEDQCACEGWPEKCVGLRNPFPPMTYTVDAVLGALRRVLEAGVRDV